MLAGLIWVLPLRESVRESQVFERTSLCRIQPTLGRRLVILQSRPLADNEYSHHAARKGMDKIFADAVKNTKLPPQTTGKEDNQERPAKYPKGVVLGKDGKP